MLGHKLWQLAGDRAGDLGHGAAGDARAEAAGLVRPRPHHRRNRRAPPGHIDAALDRARPDVVVNCVGIIKQLAAAKDPVASIAVNALYPHLLARACAARGIRLIAHQHRLRVRWDTRRVSGGRRHRTPPTCTAGRRRWARSTAPGCVTCERRSSAASSPARRAWSSGSFRGGGGTADGYWPAPSSRVHDHRAVRHPAPRGDRPITRPLTGPVSCSAAPIDKARHSCSLLNERVRCGGGDYAPRRAAGLTAAWTARASAWRRAIAPPAWEAMIAEMAADPTPYDPFETGRETTCDD